MIPNLTKQQATKLIREIALDSRNVIITTHAKVRMVERKISRQMVFECLRHGRIDRQPEPNVMKGSLECLMEHHVAGETIGVVAAIPEDNPGIIVVTVMHVK